MNSPILIAMDLDETFRPTDPRHHSRAGLQGFEQLLQGLRRRREVYFGLITGSNLELTMKKLRDYTSIRPEFLSTSLGTEFYWNDKIDYSVCKNWSNRVGHGPDLIARLDLFDRLVEPISTRLSLQPDGYYGKWLRGYYLAGGLKAGEDLAVIQQAALAAGLKAMSAQCSAAAGDPFGSYDVAAMSVLCGKREALRFAANQIGVSPKQVYAFGDSANDVMMLKDCQNGYAVGNADEVCSLLAPHRTTTNYCSAVVEVLTPLA